MKKGDLNNFAGQKRAAGRAGVYESAPNALKREGAGKNPDQGKDSPLKKNESVEARK